MEQQLRATIQQLEQQVKQLQQQINDGKKRRERIEQMSSEVVDTNPYSRLMALKRMGIVENYEKIRDYSILIVGLGGIGSVAAEMLTRCGIGKLLLFDYDKVEIANMNRLFFRPEHCGLTKTEASKVTLAEINPDVIIEAYTYNITSMDHFDDFVNRIKTGSIDKKRPVDLVLGCVDNFEARVAINQACLELGVKWMESGVSENAVSGHIQFVIPGETACFQCVPPLIVATGISEKTLKREGVCAASLPTTMGITAGILVQNALKYLLGFGKVSNYLGYNAMADFFPLDTMRPNPECPNSFCVKHQQIYQVKLKEEASKQVAQPVKEESKKPKHEENEWGITVVSDSVEVKEQPQTSDHIPRGTEFSYTVEKPKVSAADTVQADDNVDLSDLMSQLKSLSGKK